MKRLKKLLVVAGGTGGHVFPGLAVARHLIDKGWQVRWLGTYNHIEADLVPRHGIEIDFICISGLRGKGLNSLLKSPIWILNAWWQARHFIANFNPDIVLGMGGYVSGPSGLAAISLGIPIILHEQNSVAGLTNKFLAKVATKVIQAFPGAFPNAKVVGNPLRVEVLSLPVPQQRLAGRDGPLRVLVIGGSQGSSILNQVMPQVAKKLGNTINIWHQSGKGAQHLVADAYNTVKQGQHQVYEFIDDIARAYAWADLVICRAGALTVSEIASVGLPAIFVPFPHRDKQQYWNALMLKKIGAASIFEQSQFTANAIVDKLVGWNRQTLLKMAELARTIAIPDATKRVANEISWIVKS